MKKTLCSWCSFEGPTSDGGVSDGQIRVENQQMSVGVGSSDVEIDHHLNHKSPDPLSNGQTLTKVGAFDAVTFCVMYSCVHHNEITHGRLVEAIELQKLSLSL